MADTNRWFVIVNPTSGNGLAKKRWPVINQLLLENGFDFDYKFTDYAGQSIEIVQSIINQGFTKIICVGGDGTLHNIVNGIMEQSLLPTTAIKVGVIPIGTGNDWIKTHGIPKKSRDAITLISENNECVQDVGRIEFIDEVKKAVYFNNLAGVGFDGYVVHKVGKYKFIGALAYLAGALAGLFKFKNFTVEVGAAGQSIKSKSLMALVGLCQFSGGGMQLTHKSDPADGLFDITIAKDMNKWEVLSNLTKLFNGQITAYKKVDTFKTNVVSIKTENAKPFIQADGELIGQGSFSATIIPNAFCFYGTKKPA